MSRIVLIAVAVLMMGPVLAIAEGPSTQPSGPLTLRLKPYRDLSSLTEAQASRIIELHKAWVKARQELEARFHADVRALLNDAQLAELKAIEDAEQREKAARNAAKKQSKAEAEQADAKADSSDKTGR
jgi:hypothetical protein